MEQTLDISWNAIAKVLIAAAVLYMLFVAKEVVIWLFFALVISVLLNPAINFLVKWRIPRILAAMIIYGAILGTLGLMIFLTAPIFLFELNQLSQNMPGYFDKLHPILSQFGIEISHNFEDFTAGLASTLQDSSAGIFQALAVFFGGIYSTFVIFTLAFFISLEKYGIESVLRLLTPKKYEPYIIHFFERAQLKVSGFFAARILACILVGAVSFIIFFIFDVKFAFILALIAGLLNFVPYIGPTVSMILTVLFVGITNSWLVALYIFVAILAIQETEAKFLSPILMKKFMDMPPVLVLLSLVVGHVVFGFLGMIFAVPVFGLVYEFSKEFLLKKRAEEGLEYEI